MNCVAGVEVDTGRWIRLEDENNIAEHYAIADEDMMTEDNVICDVLDEVEVYCQDNDNAKEYYQVENVFIEKGKPWKKVKTWDWEELKNKILIPNGTIKEPGDGICGVKAGSNRMLVKDAEDNSGKYPSLQLIPVRNLVIEKTPTGTNHSKASFIYGDNEYKLTVTDPNYCSNYTDQIIPEAYVVCSLGVPYTSNDVTAHYILIATIIEPAHYVVWKADIKHEYSLLTSAINPPKKDKKYPHEFWYKYVNNQRLLINVPFSVSKKSEEYRIGGVCLKKDIDFFREYLVEEQFITEDGFIIVNENKSYKDAEEEFAKEVEYNEKADEYQIIRSSEGKIKSSKDEIRSYSGLKRYYGTSALIIKGKHELKDKFDNEGVFENKGETKETNSSLIPTLCKLYDLKEKNGKLEGNLDRIYDDNIVRSFLKTGNLFSVSLPERTLLNNTENDVKEYRYTSASSGDFVLKLPKNKKNKMLMLELIEKKRG